MDALSYSMRTVEFSGRSTYIVCCGKDSNASLVSIANFLLLSEGPPASMKNATRGADGKLCVDRSSLVDLVYNLMVRRLRKHVKEAKISQSHMDEVLKSAKTKSEIRKLAVKLDLYPGFESITCFKCVMSEITKLLLTGIKADVYHGMLPDPVEDNILCNLVEGKYLVDFIELPGNLSEVDKNLINNFMNMTSPLTPYGLSFLQKDVQEHSLSLLWHYCCISVLYKHDGALYLLRTYGEHPDLMWCSLLNHAGDGDPFSSNFSPINIQENPEDITKDLIKEEEKAKGQKLIEEDKAKGRKKNRGKHNKQKNAGQTSGRKLKKDQTDPYKIGKAIEPTLRDRFIDFLFGYSITTKQQKILSEIG